MKQQVDKINMNEKEDLEELQCFVSNIQNDWKTR